MIRLAYLSVLLGFLACGSSEGRASAPPAAMEAGAGAEAGGSAAAETGPPALAGDALQDRLPPPGRAWVIFDNDTVQAEIARTPEERARGLMYREDLPEGEGMLFIFPDSQIRSFWMSNTFVPLDIAYIDEELRIVDIQAMEPETTDSHPSARPAMFALEVPMGWFERTGIGVGAQATVVFGPGS